MEGTIGEVRMFGGTFAPRNWSFCNGSLLSIASNTALFSILGNNFGGDGRVTFGLPNLQGRVAIAAGTGPGLSTYSLGESGGTESEVITTLQMPAHNHQVVASLNSILHPSCSTSATGNTSEPDNTVPSVTTSNIYSSVADATLSSVNLSNFAGGVTVAPAGSGFPHNNIMPTLAVNYVICMYGVFPMRN